MNNKYSLVYSRFEGSPISDHQAEETAKTLKETNLTVSTENVIHAFRLLILQGFFKYDEVKVLFEAEEGKFFEILFDQHGRTHDWYIGFCDTNDKVLQGLLGWYDGWKTTPEGDKYEEEGED
jgi:hypothetical protein